jgi:hydrogen peroxide-dependent heme synthase
LASTFCNLATFTRKRICLAVPVNISPLIGQPNQLPIFTVIMSGNSANAALPNITPPAPLLPREGWHALHLFYHVEQGLWSLLSNEEKRKAKQRLNQLILEIRATPSTQLLTFSMMSPKSDIGFMLLTADLHVANAFEKRLTSALGPDVLAPVYSYFSMTEWTEYSTKPEEYAAKIMAEKGFAEGSPELAKEMETFDQHQKKYYQDRLYPNLPDWPVMCFYPMSKRRNDGNNWYHQEFDTRKKLMAGHATTGRRWSGKIRQLITGSTGLDEYEWGVTLFSHNSSDVKGIVYEMRFDEVSAKYAEFGDFYIGLQLPVDEILRRVCPLG